MSRSNGRLGERLIELFNSLQLRETTFGQIYSMSACVRHRCSPITG